MRYSTQFSAVKNFIVPVHALVLHVKRMHQKAGVEMFENVPCVQTDTGSLPRSDYVRTGEQNAVICRQEPSTSQHVMANWFRHQETSGHVAIDPKRTTINISKKK